MNEMPPSTPLPVRGKTEEELLAKLELWLEEHIGEARLSDVAATNDGELLAAFILKGFRAAARRAVLARND